MLTDGYKETEIGVIPVEWDIKQIKDFSIIATGNTPPTKDIENYGTEYPWITPTDINDSKNIYYGERSLSIQGYSKARQLPKNTVLITSIASIGKNAILREQGSCNQQINAILPSDNHISDYVYYWFENNVNKVIALAGQTAVLMINKTDFSNIKIPLPPLKEQEKIADVLSTADEKIDAIELQIQKAETLKKGLLQKLLSVGIGHSEFKDSELGKIPVGWEVEKIGNVCDCIVPGRNKPVDFNGNIPWITTPDLENKYISKTKSNLYISKDEADRIGSKIVPVNSIIMSCVGNLGILAITKNEMVINQQLHAFLPSLLVDMEFLHYSLLTQQKYMNKIATKTAVPYMNKDNCNSIPIVLPPLKEQKQIANILSTADDKLEVLRAKKEKYETLKKGLLQKLLSGEVRV